MASSFINPVIIVLSTVSSTSVSNDESVFMIYCAIASYLDRIL